MPCALMDTLTLEHGVHYGQTVTSTEVQQQSTLQVQIGKAVPPNHTPPGNTVHPVERQSPWLEHPPVPLPGPPRRPGKLKLQ